MRKTYATPRPMTGRTISFVLKALCIPVLAGLVLGIGGPWESPAGAQSSKPLSLFRDAEIEDTIGLYAAPLFEAANLDPDRIEIHLVDNNVLNAFVANGRHMFLFSGILIESEDPGLIIGVIAHETGHLAAGHLARTRGAHEDASAMVVLSAVLGVAVGIAGGGEAGVAILAAGSELGARDYLRFSRVQESAADQAALRYLETAGQSARGLRDLMVTLSESETLLAQGSEIPYFLSHPPSTERARTMDAHIERSKFSDRPWPPDLVDRQKRMVAKIHGFLEPSDVTYLRYPEAQESIHSRYAWAIAKYRERLMEEALALVDGLIAEEPDNPYFHELRGQMLHETGSTGDAVASYRRAVMLAPDQPLLRIGLAEALLQPDDPEAWREAVEHLESARRQEDDHPPTWSLLGQAYEKLDMQPKSRVARAEMHFLRGEVGAARGLAERAIDDLGEGTPDWFRAADIIAATGDPKGG